MSCRSWKSGCGKHPAALQPTVSGKEINANGYAKGSPGGQLRTSTGLRPPWKYAVSRHAVEYRLPLPRYRVFISNEAASAEARYSINECFRIGLLGAGQDTVGVTRFDDPAFAHHRDSLANARRNTQVVRDQQQCAVG